MDNRASQCSDSSPGEPARGPLRSAPATAAWWVIAVSLAVIAACLLVSQFGGHGPQAFAQPVTMAGARSVFAFTGQLTKSSYGLFMVDVDTGTIWCYEYQGGKNALKLVAAREWLYDRYLKDFSTEPPTEVIKEMLEDQRKASLQAANP